MASTCNLQEKYCQVRRNFCFYIDVQDHGLSRTLSKRIEDLGLQQDIFLTPRVTHIIRDTSVAAPGARWSPREAARSRADAMLQRIRTDQRPAQQQGRHVTLTVQKAIILLDKIYDTFFSAPRKSNIRVFRKHFIKIEFLDKVCRPVYKEFDEWPEISLEPDPPREKRDSPEIQLNQNINNIIIGQKMTRKSRPRIKEREDKETKGGYCEMCNTDYTDATLHRRSPHHLAFVRDHTNFLSLDTLIGSGADVATFLDKATPINGERRSLRNTCNGDAPKRRSKRSQSPDSTVNGNDSPKANGIDDEKKHNTRCSKRNCESQQSEDRQYYKVVGVSTKLRSSGGFASKQKESPPACNGTKPIVVKFRKVRRSELSVLSDEAEQFMFPKRASSTSSTSSDEEEEEKAKSPKSPKSPAQTPPSLERRRLARPVALKEESSEEDSWPEDKMQRQRRVPTVVKRARRMLKLPPPPEPEKEEEKVEPTAEEVSPLREEVAEPVERCMKWEDGRLKYTPAVEQLEFAFESVPHSEPWFETFRRQDQDQILTKNVPHYFSLYTKSPKLPYEIGQLPPLKPNCCPLSDLVKRDEKAGPSRSYGTRGMKKQKIKKRTLALMALESHPRKSPREHASTLAILGSAGIVSRRKNGDDTKSTASEDTVSETLSNIKVEPIKTETQEASERLQQFLSEVYDDAAEYELPEDAMEDEAVAASRTAPDLLQLVSECDQCDIIRDQMKEEAPPPPPRPRGRRTRVKKNRTGWPKTKKVKKGGSRGNSTEVKDGSLDADGSSIDAPEDEAQGSISEVETKIEPEESSRHSTTDEDDKPLRIDLQVLLRSDDKKRKEDDKVTSASEAEEEQPKVKKKRTVAVGEWLQPVVRVARVEPRTLRSAAAAAKRPRARANRKR